MIVLDTNVVSALMRPAENPGVVAWLNRQRTEQVWISSISVYEIRYGLLLMQAGRRRVDLFAAFETFSRKAVGDRFLSFDEKAAESAAKVSAALKMQGRNIGVPDAQIAGIALSRRAAIATRNLRDFDDLDIPLIDPWAD